MVGSGHRGYGRDIGLIIHLSASTGLGPDPNHKVLVTSVEKAIQMGADAVSVHVNVGSKKEPEMLMQLGSIAEICDDWGMPLIAMMYPRGEKIKDEYDPEVIKHVSRLGAELGADLVKGVTCGAPFDWPGPGMASGSGGYDLELQRTGKRRRDERLGMAPA